jgi:hypothetical protein
MGWVVHEASMKEMRNAYRILTGNFEGQRPQAKRKLIWEANIKRDLWEIRLRVWIVFIWHGVGTGGGLL